KAKDLIARVRDTRNKNGIKNKEALNLYVEDSPRAHELFSLSGVEAMVAKMANLQSVGFAKEEIPNSIAFLSATEKYYLQINQTIDVDAEREKLLEELKYFQGFVASVEKKLSNERFVQNAPEAVVAKEQQKLADGQAKIKLLEESLEKLS
ncbi:MAG: valine--tRNA ligase, partial [Saprospiraceae bacterium]|nr:valine--tRNA ligase [Saprospiraceae bacterium]